MELTEEKRKEICEKLWANHSYLRADLTRWHTSGYHIEPNSITLANWIEEVFSDLDTTPDELEECGITGISENYSPMDDVDLVATFAGFLFNKLKPYGKFGFEEPKDWKKAVEENF